MLRFTTKLRGETQKDWITIYINIPRISIKPNKRLPGCVGWGVPGLSFLEDTFSLEWPWQQSRLICSTLTPLYLLLLLDISSLRKERKWSDATPALWYLFRDKYSPRPSALLFASGKPSLWCEASLILISLDTLCLLLAATASADLPNYCQANSGIEAGRGGGERGGNK